ncbi:YciE/YciF ferroxidase family protein [Aureibaculum luteum]|uniref:YciE/YciF ferroxidase family protein n=1 Tax=Aureibaculum luteum TaxID=1548456 RepID=UPI000E48CCA5|nr:ferritin-like domain-containing protein [Aureibaculum luteum]
MKTLNDLFNHQIKDLYSAETQLLSVLPKMAKNANNKKLIKAFENHLKETKEQKSKLETICRVLNISPSGAKCHAMKGLIKEAKIFMKAVEDNEVMDAGLIAEAQRIEHYEISGYGTAVRYAKELGLRKVAKNLQEILNEEYNADHTLNEIAENRVNRKALERIK